MRRPSNSAAARGCAGRRYSVIPSRSPTSSRAGRPVPKPPMRFAPPDTILHPGGSGSPRFRQAVAPLGVRPARPSIPRPLSVPVSLHRSIPIRSFNPTPQGFGERALQVAAARGTGAFGQFLGLLPGPILRADARRRFHEIIEGVLDE